MSLTKYINKVAEKLDISEDEKSKIDKIIPRLYIGGYKAAEDPATFKKFKIKAVLNCTKTKDVSNKFAGKDIEYMRIPVSDSLKQVDIEKMYNYFPTIVEFIYKHVDIEKNAVLVNCVQGMQRSAIAVAAYLVAKHGMTPKEACRLILSKRRVAFHNGNGVNFEKALNKYYKELYGQ